MGSFDWHKQFLGGVTRAAFAGGKGNTRAFVASDQGAVAALDFKTGQIGASREEAWPTAQTPVRTAPHVSPRGEDVVVVAALPPSKSILFLIVPYCLEQKAFCPPRS